uniref:Coproporphyrinogen III oxidase n=1 Tax=Acidobacterium capsulatum TaxID=33075 RepID=A0A7V5CUE7_9BACT
MKHTVILGGGITGLTAAYILRQSAGGAMRVTLLESSQRLGGKIATAEENGFLMEGGPDSFLARKRVTMDICRELGLEEQLMPTAPGERTTYVWSGGKLHPLPMGVTPMLRSKLISWPGKLRMGAEALIPPRSVEEDESLASFVGRRFGREALDKLAAPLMAGIYSADANRLSMQSNFAMLPAMEKKHGSVLRGWLRSKQAYKKSGAGAGTMFLTLRGGMRQLVDALVAELPREDVRLGCPALAVLPRDGKYEVVLRGGESLLADDVILATPAEVSARLLDLLDPQLAARLRMVRSVSTATVSLGFRESDVAAMPRGFGFVVPRQEGRKITACTWSSMKFAGRAPEGHLLLRVFMGGAGAEHVAEQDGAALVEAARQELRRTMGIAAEPVAARVYRWEKGTPQYEVGHAERVAEIEALAHGHRGLFVAGAAYHGAGVPDCMQNALDVAGRLAAQYGMSTVTASSAGPVVSAGREQGTVSERK